MSDRIAVFNYGKVEQVGSPAQVYEHPATPFVAGFVGTSNLISGDMATRITGQPAVFSIRPEKIHLSGRDAPVDGDSFSADGRVRDVIYLGLYTRYLVELNGGGDLVVVEQNIRSTSMDVMQARGRDVRLIWKKEHVRYVEA